MSERNRIVVGWTLLLTLLCTMPCLAFEPNKDQWPRWRGPGADGSGPTGAFPVQWSGTENLAWKVELPGIGCSTPIVWQQSIVLTVPVDGRDAVVAMDRQGKQRWQTPISPQRRGKHRNGSGSNPSPTTDGRQIFAYFKSGTLAALDFDGRLQWKANLQERFGKDTLYWDIGTSPVLTEQHVIVAVMHDGDSYLAAYDKASGKLAWHVARNYECPVEGDHSYATPTVVQQGGKQMIVVWGAEHVTAHDAADGRLVWSCGGFNPQQKRNWVAVASAVVTGDTVAVPYGRGSQLAGVKLGGSGDVSETHRLWTRDGLGSFVPTPAAQGGRIYLLGDRGQVWCVEAATGATVWQGELPKNRNKYYASPVVVDGKLYATREDGAIFVVSATGQFKVLAENVMGERMIASPVPVGGQLLLRGERHLFCVQAPEG